MAAFCSQSSALQGRCSVLTQITAIVVTYNSAHCAPALGHRLSGWPHVIVVDNGSDDTTAAAIRRQLPLAQVIELGENRGFGAANNAALARVATPYALLINPDCEVDAEQAKGLLDTLQAWPDAAVVAPQLVDGSGKAQLNYGWVRHLWASRGPGAEAVTCVANACGAALLLRLSAWPVREWFDTRFFLYYEDEDLCLRLLQAGKPVLVDPVVRVVHANRGSVRGPHPLRVEWGRGYHHARSKILFTAKHRGSRLAVSQRRRALAGAIGMLLLRVFAPSPKHVTRVWGRLQGLWSAPVRY